MGTDWTGDSTDGDSGRSGLFRVFRSRFRRRQGAHRQRMDRPGELFLKRAIHKSLARDPVQALKRATDHQHSEVRLAAIGRAGMSRVEMRFIFHIQRNRLQGF